MRTRQLQPSEIFERDLVPLLGTGCRVAMLCGGGDTLLQTVEEAAVAASERTRGTDGTGVVFLQLILDACVRRSAPAAPRTGRPLSHPSPDPLDELSVAARAAVALDLAEYFPPAEVARILGCTEDEARGLQLMAEDAFLTPGPRTERPALQLPSRALRLVQ